MTGVRIQRVKVCFTETGENGDGVVWWEPFLNVEKFTGDSGECVNVGKHNILHVNG